MNALLAFPGLSEAKPDFAYDIWLHVGFRASTDLQKKVYYIVEMVLDSMQTCFPLICKTKHKTMMLNHQASDVYYIHRCQ